jgi:hypothetical protein
MKCPKCHHVNLEGATECDDCGVQFSDIRPRSSTQQPKIQRTCPWNDHGTICGLIGSLADSYLGPWYCSTHYWQLKGWTIKKSNKPPTPYRERWYAERGLPYEPPNLAVNAPPFQHVGDMSLQVLKRLRSGQLGPPRTREPGDDDEPITQI